MMVGTKEVVQEVSGRERSEEAADSAVQGRDGMGWRGWIRCEVSEFSCGC